jgi:outer membrane receptor protein involved in Fe transport
VPIIYHFGGLSSVVPTEMLEKIDFYPGNFSSEYGRAMGGIVDVGLRSPREDGKYHGVAQLDLIDGRLVVEGPIPFVKNWSAELGGYVARPRP